MVGGIHTFRISSYAPCRSPAASGLYSARDTDGTSVTLHEYGCAHVRSTRLDRRSDWYTYLLEMLTAG